MTRDNDRYFKRNFALGVVTGALVNVGMAFLDPFTVLPVFVSKLGGSAALIGLVSALHGVGWFLPQIFASRFAATRYHLIHMYRVAALIRVVAFASLVYAIFSLDATNQRFVLPVFVATLFVAHLAGGFSAIPFLEITGKTIPVKSRGNFFATRRLIGGVLGVIAGVVVGLILDENGEDAFASLGRFDFFVDRVRDLGLMGHEFPVDFAIVFLLGSLCLSAGILTFAFAGEPPAASVEKSVRFLTQLKSGFALLRADRNYRRFYLVRICWQFTAMAFPFYASYAYNELQFSENLVGLFLSIWVGAGVFSNYIWGQLLDRKGNKIVLLVTAAFSALPPLVILTLDIMGGGSGSRLGGGQLLLLVLSTFFINGFIRSGRIISNITYLLEVAPEVKRPLYIGFMNSFSFPFMFSPLLGGLILEVFGTPVLFALCLGFALVNIALSVGLKEPRRPDRT